MDKKSKFIFSYMFVAKKLKDPKTAKEGLDYIEQNREIFKINNNQLNKLKKELDEKKNKK